MDWPNQPLNMTCFIWLLKDKPRGKPNDDGNIFVLIELIFLNSNTFDRDVYGNKFISPLSPHQPKKKVSKNL